jgi:nucleotide-binding universal stress UspA family protein
MREDGVLKRRERPALIKKILVPVDFSSYSDQVVDYAATMAQGFKARVILMHVVEPFHYSVTDTLNVINHDRALKTIAASLLDNSCKMLRERGLSVDIHLTSGSPHREIVKKSHQDKVNMIIMGTHGRTGLEHILFGSVAEKVLRLATCPVLTVRSKLPGKKVKPARRARRTASHIT